MSIPGMLRESKTWTRRNGGRAVRKQQGSTEIACDRCAKTLHRSSHSGLPSSSTVLVQETYFRVCAERFDGKSGQLASLPGFDLCEACFKNAGLG